MYMPVIPALGKWGRGPEICHLCTKFHPKSTELRSQNVEGSQEAVVRLRTVITWLQPRRLCEPVLKIKRSRTARKSYVPTPALKTSKPWDGLCWLNIEPFLNGSEYGRGIQTKISLDSQGWPGTHCVDQIDLELNLLNVRPWSTSGPHTCITKQFAISPAPQSRILNKSMLCQHTLTVSLYHTPNIKGIYVWRTTSRWSLCSLVNSNRLCKAPYPQGCQENVAQHFVHL